MKGAAITGLAIFFFVLVHGTAHAKQPAATTNPCPASLKGDPVTEQALLNQTYERLPSILLMGLRFTVKKIVNATVTEGSGMLYPSSNSEAHRDFPDGISGRLLPDGTFLLVHRGGDYYCLRLVGGDLKGFIKMVDPSERQYGNQYDTGFQRK